MPADIMSCTCPGENFCKSFRTKSNATEVKSGFLVFLGPDGIQDVRVVVYRTSLEHFAVIYPRKRVMKEIGVLNLRNTVVEQSQSNSGFNIRQKGYDNTISAQFVCSEREVESWMSAFTSRSSPQSTHTSLPVVVETEES